MKDVEPRRIDFRNLGKVGGALLAVGVAVGACGYMSPEDQAQANHKYEVQLSNSSGLGRNWAECYTNDKPVLLADGSKADVKITNGLCFGDSSDFGITPDTSFPEIEVIADSISVVQSPNVK